MTAERALTIKQPWAWAIMHGGKNIENRSWTTTHRGRLWIHVGNRVANTTATGHNPPALMGRARTAGQLHRGALLGYVQLVDVVRGHHSEWAAPENYHWVLADPVVLPEPVPMPGRLGLWRVPDDVLKGIKL